MYTVFVRNWWKENKNWPNGLEPDPTARKYIVERNIKDENTAREIAQKWNRTHKPGRLSRKAEFEEQ